jgi:hypothetical protein
MYQEERKKSIMYTIFAIAFGRRGMDGLYLRDRLYIVDKTGDEYEFMLVLHLSFSSFSSKFASSQLPHHATRC